MNYDATLTQDMRLRILQTLVAQPAYTTNEVALAQAMMTRWGHALSADRLRAELAWLDEQGLLTLQQPGGVFLATLAGRGADVARGLARMPGVAVPRPGEA